MARYRPEIRKAIEDIYKLYPKKMGKTRGINSAMAQCKNDKDLNLLKLAIENYKAYVDREGKEPQFILYFSTFMGQWRDWLEEDIGTVVKPKVDLSDMGFEE